MTTEAQAPVKRGPGRPRDPEVERRMKRAALETLAEHGFSGLTLERICERAGAPRATSTAAGRRRSRRSPRPSTTRSTFPSCPTLATW